MKRRSVLTALGASVVPLTGCTGLGAENSTQSPSNTETQTPLPYSGDSEVRLSSVDDVPTDVPLEPSAEVTQSKITADQTARIRVSLTNTADQAVWNTNVRIPAFSSFISKAGPEGQKLLLLQPDEQYDTASAECWRADLTEPELNHAYTDVVTDIRYDADESKATEFDIYGHPENANRCLVPGAYPIESKYHVADNDESTDEITWEYTWGFSITVEES